MGSQIIVVLFLTVICSLTMNVLADPLAPESHKSEDDVHAKPAKALSAPYLKENETSVTTESLSIIVPSDSIINSTSAKIVPVKSGSVKPEKLPEKLPEKPSVSGEGKASNPQMPSLKPEIKKPSSAVPVPVRVPETVITRHDIEILKKLATEDIGKWIIRNTTTNVTCIIAQMAVQLNITYPAMNNKVENAVVDLPAADVMLNGSCTNSSQSMTIYWGPGHSLQLNFAKNESAKDFYVNAIELNVNASVFKNFSGNIDLLLFKNTKPEFVTPLDMSYKCDKATDVNLTSSDPKLTTVLTMKNTQLEAYVNSNKTEFGAAQDCELFETPDIVPIAVGCALAILVLVVLVAYLIGRKRSQNRGYLSM